ncbi:helix-turn-helix transcriptional regulator [Solirubrum puertoriconensis]|uniref:HTH luxR-type domain-containing protein n=1 Tax=Solirubrum puertoriconensis TaxID=1751427 RepID=A0A9X0HI33_SOLP1|nr:LuxR family transcriptional regulator [Solirubrum puertoriconensis]KUG06288.1 hypothetical protein ASU33_02705 [Solirubrum puertoriconensis]
MSTVYHQPSPEVVSLQHLLETCHALSQHTDQHLIGLLSKHTSTGEPTLVREQLPTLRHLVRSGAQLHQQLQQPQRTSASKLEAQSQSGPEVLSTRELEVLRLLAKGYTQQQVAEELFISPTTVNNHCARMREKLGLRGRNALLTFAFSRQ